MSELPFISCLCPSFRRPDLLANAVGCWLAQDYPLKRRELIIVEDGRTFTSDQQGEGWRLVTIPQRFRSLSAKYNFALSLVDPRATLVCPWEDDDIYLPWHLATHAQALTGNPAASWSQPLQTLSDYHQSRYESDWQTEPATGRFHGQWCFRRSVLERVGGWPDTLARDFDTQLGTALSQYGDTAHPMSTRGASYCYRWWAAPNASAIGGHTSWWKEAERLYPPLKPRPALFPWLDGQTRGLMQRLGIPVPAQFQPDLQLAPDVVITSTNFSAPGWLADCLRSVRAQTIQPVSVTIVEDSSDEANRSLTRELAEQHGARLLVTSFGHPQPARAVGVAQGHSPVVVCLDGDDVWHPRYLECGLPLLACPWVSVVYSDALKFGDSGGVWEPREGTKPLEHNWMHSGCLVRRQSLEQSDALNRQPTHDFEDAWTWSEVLKMGGISAKAIGAAYYYRQHAGSRHDQWRARQETRGRQETGAGLSVPKVPGPSPAVPPHPPVVPTVASTGPLDLISTYTVGQPDPQRPGHVWLPDAPELIEWWVETARDTGARVTLLVDHDSPRVRARWPWLHVLQVPPCPATRNGMTYRWELLKFWLSSALPQQLAWTDTTAPQWVLHTDLFDVRFGCDPLPILQARPEALHVGSERDVIDGTTIPGRWMLARLMESAGHVPPGLVGQQILNCGIVGGRADVVTNFVQGLCQIIASTPAYGTGNDMAPFNELLRGTDKWPIVTGEPLHSVFREYQRTRRDVAVIHK